MRLLFANPTAQKKLSIKWAFSLAKQIKQHTFHASKAVLDDCHTIRAIHAFDGCGKVMVAVCDARSRAFRHAEYLFEVKQVGVVMQAQING